MQCLDNATCNFTCSGGFCTFTQDATATMTTSCTGGNCGG
jgi:hypothetical protein